MSDAEVDPSKSVEDLSKKYALTTAPFDARFPNQNQTKNCWQNYCSFFRCVNARGEDFEPCKLFKQKYHSLCPNEWISKWDDQRENGTFPAVLDE